MKQLFVDVLQKRCSERIHKIYRKTPVLGSLFIKTQPLSYNFIKRDSSTRVSFEFCKSLRTLFLTEHLQTVVYYVFTIHNHFSFLCTLQCGQNIGVAVWRCSIKKVFFKISQNSLKSTCARVSFFKNTFFYRTPPVVVSEDNFQQYITYFNNFLTEVLLSLSGHCFGAPDWKFTDFIFYMFTFHLIHLIICACSFESLNKIFSTFNIFERPITVWKVSKYGVISGPYFPVLRLNMEIYGVSLRIQSEYREIRTRNNSLFGHFSRSAIRSR